MFPSTLERHWVFFITYYSFVTLLYTSTSITVIVHTILYFELCYIYALFTSCYASQHCTPTQGVSIGMLKLLLMTPNFWTGKFWRNRGVLIEVRGPRMSCLEKFIAACSYIQQSQRWKKTSTSEMSTFLSKRVSIRASHTKDLQLCLQRDLCGGWGWGGTVALSTTDYSQNISKYSLWKISADKVLAEVIWNKRHWLNIVNHG